MEQKLSILTWPDYINPQTLQQFESEFDASVELAIVPSAVELAERMKNAWNGPAADVLVAPDYAVRELQAQGRLLKLDHSLLPNLAFLETHFSQGRSHDPGSEVSVIKDWGTTGFMYRTDMVNEPLASWSDFWRVAEKMSGYVTVLDSPGEVIGAALKMRGHSYNAAAPEALAGARDDLLRLKPHLLAFETNYKPLLASGSACFSLGWNGDAAALAGQGIPVRYVLPGEGSQIWEDDWAISVDTSHAELAYAFINFLLRPDIAAQEARYTRYATANRAARALLDAEIGTDQATYPPQKLLAKLEYGMPLDADAQERREQLWREIRD